MQNKLSSIGAELEKDRCKSVEIRQLTDTEKFTSQLLLECNTLLFMFYVIEIYECDLSQSDFPSFIQRVCKYEPVYEKVFIPQ